MVFSPVSLLRLALAQVVATYWTEVGLTEVMRLSAAPIFVLRGGPGLNKSIPFLNPAVDEKIAAQGLSSSLSS